VQLAGPVVVEYLREDARMPVEEVLVEYRVVVGQRLGQPRQPRRRDLLQGGLVRLVTDAAHVEYDAVFGVAHHRRHLCREVIGSGARGRQSRRRRCVRQSMSDERVISGPYATTVTATGS